ncbi:MAG: hypothetical protein H8E15_17215 [Planctomycetes bacterium]|nr:hypothetical protein [Planctomycetota bacterium]
MKHKLIALPTLGATVFLIGYFLPTAVGGAPRLQPMQNFLTELHLHGSISEGRASMWHHSEGLNYSNVGYDVLWWTDHMDRTTARAFPQAIDFNNGEFWGEFAFGVSRLVNNAPATTRGANSGGADPYAIFTHTNPATPEWTAGGGILVTQGKLHRICLLADPEIRMDLRLPTVSAPNDVNVVVRVTLSSRRGDGTSEAGAPNIIEYINFGLVPPTLDNGKFHNTVQIPKFDVRGPGFTSLLLRPLSDSENHFYEKGDQTIFQIEIMGASRNGEEVAIEVDNFELSVDPSRSDKNLFVAVENLVQSGVPPYNNLTQHVGMEMAGPLDQKIAAISGRDHVVALYRDSIQNSIDEIYDFLSPELAEGWPRKGVELVHGDNGVAILAHIFSPKIPPDVMPEDKIRFLSERVITNRAFGADAIEIGYVLRGAPLETFIDIWDKLSANRVYITGVGTSDHHNVKDWKLRINNMGTWIQALTDSPANLADAIQSGHAYFGDPYRFDSYSGSLDFRISGSTTTMGDVRTIAEVEPVRFKVDLTGAMPNDDLVWLHNGVVVDRHHLSSSARTAFKQLIVKPGDWVRIEMRSEEDQVYLLSNPIYFVAYGEPVPPHREG